MKVRLARANLLLCSAALIILMTALQLLPESTHIALRYSQPELAGGEFWRLLSANFIHLGWVHLAMNAAALALMAMIFQGHVKPLSWLGLVLVSGVCSNAGMFAFSPQPGWVVGLSGALHGVFAAGALRLWQHGDRMAGAMLLALVAKILWEQWRGGMPASGEFIGGVVAVDAHLWGTVGGVIAAAVAWLAHARSARRR